MDWSLERAHWAEVIAHLPEMLPSPGHPSCDTGPLVIVKLRGGSELDYACDLPPGIRETRAFIISLRPRS